MPSKSGRYVINYWILDDAENHHCYHAISYLAKEGDIPDVNLSAQVVKNLAEPMKETNRNVTWVRHFSSFDLFKELYKSNLTSAGIAMPNRRYLPLSLLPKHARGRGVGSTLFAFKDNLTIVSWHSKRSKSDLLLAYLHHNSHIVESDKAEMYNFTIKLKETLML